MVATAALIEKDGRFLISKRKDDVVLPGAWEFPGGKLEADESPEDCVVREIEEEIGVKAKAESLADVVFYRYDDFNVLLVFYSCRILTGEPRALDCAEVKWIDVSDFPAYDFPSADLAVIDKLMLHKEAAA